MSSYTLTIPAPTEWLSSNQRLHWARRAKLTRTWREAACWRAIGAKLPLGLARVSITATIHRTDNRRADAHNRLPTIKAAIDGVVDAGVLLDDSDKHIASLTIEAGPAARVPKQPWGRLVLTITDLEAS